MARSTAAQVSRRERLRSPALRYDRHRSPAFGGHRRSEFDIQGTPWSGDAAHGAAAHDHHILRARLAPPPDLEKTLHSVDLDKPALLADLGIGLGQCAEQFERGAGRSGVVGHHTMVARQVRPATISRAGAGARAAQGNGLQSRTVAGSNPARRSSARGLPFGSPRRRFKGAFWRNAATLRP